MSERQGPLQGLRVVEFAGLGPGPFCGMLLADLGAQVVQIDRPGSSTAHYGLDPRRNLLHRGRRAIILDLRQAEQVETALRLVEKADVVIEPNRPGVAEKLGVGPDTCLARNPRLVYGRMTGWGQDGPRAHHAGHDINYIALSGALHTIGPADDVPAIPNNFVGDMGGGGLFLAFGILAAIYEAQRSGQGQVVDAAMIEGAALQLMGSLTMKANGLFTDRRGSHFSDGASHFYQAYRTRDDKYLSVGAIEPQFYRAFREGLGVADDPAFDRQMDPAAWPDLKVRTAAIIATRTRDEWAEIFSGESCVAPILSTGELADDPHLAARGSFVTLDGCLQAAPGPRFSRTPGAIANPPPVPGQDSEDILREWGVA
ncbi:CaiB/BaiF CoA transferase family protein [Flavisphingomonas formosensis]|uniref:CaiB/BaiF CoA transferase family protein n=1 Tax=Flavisphingomonas formosensis TaxID=861534 RepID=UPI0012FC3071|nr:CaiB/BaiF CoA-transferase family protein [Sphingomonas formosensis]